MPKKIAMRITPTANDDSFFINELVKEGGVWRNKPDPKVRAVPVYIKEHTTVYELMDILANRAD